MRLPSFDIQQQLTEIIQFFLAQDNLLFPELKNLILSKTTIPFIQTHLEQRIADAKAADLKKIKITLEKKYYDDQLNEDECDKQKDNAQNDQDIARQKYLIEQLAQHREIIGHEKGLLQNQIQLAQLLQNSMSATHAHSHGNNTDSDDNNTHSHDNNTHSHGNNAHSHGNNAHSHGNNAHSHDSNAHSHDNTNAINYANLLRDQKQLRKKIDELELQSAQISNELNIINTKKNVRDLRQKQREERFNARLDFVQNRGGITNTLSANNQFNLSNERTRQYQIIEAQSAALIAKATGHNLIYSIFLEQIECSVNNLKNNTLQEKEALRKIIQLIKQHINYNKEITTHQQRIADIIKINKEDETRLCRHHASKNRLQDENPQLNRKNEQIASENTLLEKIKANHIASRKRLAIPGLSLFALAIVTSIPFILIMTGIIPYFIAPALLLPLAIIPPAFLLLIAASVGISALVYAIKSNRNSSSIDINQRHISTNKNQMRMNENELHVLEHKTIPELKRKIDVNQQQLSKLTKELQHAQQGAEQTFLQAQNTEPVKASLSYLFRENQDLKTPSDYIPIQATP